MPTPLANALAQYAPPKQQPSTPLANALMEYASRVKGDFQHGLDESAQGFGEMVNGQLATGIPRTFLGGLGWMGSPVSGAVSPLLNPVLQPVAQGVHDYVGQPLESATGYPADLTTELALALALPKALHTGGRAVNASIPYLASLGDAVGSRFGSPADAYHADVIPFPRKPTPLAEALTDTTKAQPTGTVEPTSFRAKEEARNLAELEALMSQEWKKADAIAAQRLEQRKNAVVQFDPKSPISSPVGGGTDPRGGIPLDVLNNRAKAASLRLKLDPLEASLKKALLAKDVEQAAKIREKLKGLRGQISSLDPS